MGETIKKSLIELGVFSISDLVRITPVKRSDRADWQELGFIVQ
jgi:hypothetical protein